MNYTTVDALRKFGGFGASKDDILVHGMITAASRLIDNHCKRRFAVETETVHTFTRRALLPHLDPFNGSILMLDDDLAEAASLITGTPTVSYLPSSSTPYWAIVNEDGGWTSPISVTGFWAFSKSAPEDIEFVCMRLAKWLYELRETTRGDAVVVTDQGAVLMPAALPADVLAVLSTYVRIGIA